MVGPSGDVARSTACTRSPGCARRGPFGPSGGDIRPAWPLTFGHCHVAARWGFIGRCSIRACGGHVHVFGECQVRACTVLAVVLFSSLKIFLILVNYPYIIIMFCYFMYLWIWLFFSFFFL